MKFFSSFAPPSSFARLRSTLFWVGTILVAAPSLPTAKAAEDRPNIVFYLADDQNYWDYGFAGNPHVTTPHLNALALQSLRFTRAYTSMSICTPSRSTLYTGLLPLGHGSYMNHIPSRPGVRSAPHYLGPLGYETILAGKSHVKPDSVYAWDAYFPAVKSPKEARNVLPLADLKDYLSNATSKFCIFLASDFPHGPYPDRPALLLDQAYTPPGANPKPNLKQRAGYYDSIATDDRQVGSVIALLQQTGQWENTIFIYAADHGIDGKYTVSDQGLRVPLLIRFPANRHAGQSTDALISLTDILPTFIEWAGGQVPAELDGISLHPLIEGQVARARDELIGVQTWQNVQKAKVFPARTIIEQRYKLTENFNAQAIHERNFGVNPVVNAFIAKGANAFPHTPKLELYDVIADPFEHHNLADLPEHTATTERLRARLRTLLAAQHDFVLERPAAILLKPTLHPLDETSQWKQVEPELEGKLTPEDYRPSHD